MRLLILTQEVNKDDPVMGFFHNWIKDFSSIYEKIVVICLKEASHDLPRNVKVLSLGKEEGLRRLGYILRFYKYIWQERKNYDAVFVHMNQEYILLGGLFWKLFNKKIVMWRNHTTGNFFTKVSIALSDRVFCTSAQAFTAKYKKTSIMPVGIDTKIFTEDKNIERKSKSILFLSRISPVKKLEIILEALIILDKEGIDFTFSIVGDPTSKDLDYYKQIQKQAKSLIDKGRVMFGKGIPNTEAPKVFSAHEIFINATQIGSFDKTILEALACGSLVVTSNIAVKGMIPDRFIFKEYDAKDMADKIKHTLSLSEEEREQYKQLGRESIQSHSLDNLGKKLFEDISNLYKQ